MGLSYPAVRSFDAFLSRPRGFEPAKYWESSAGLSSVENDIFMDTFREGPFLQMRHVFLTSPPDVSSSNPTGHRGVLSKEFFMNLFKLYSSIQSFAVPSPSTGDPLTLQDLCFRSSASDDACVIHSPLEYWRNDLWRLTADPDIYATLGSRHVRSSMGVPMSMPLVFGGITSNETTGFPAAASSAVLTFFFDAQDRETIQNINVFWESFWESACESEAERSLVKMFGVEGAVCKAEGNTRRFLMTFNQVGYEQFAEMLLLGLSYFLVFLYISLSLGRVDLVKSRFGLGFSAVVLVLSSFTMSFGVCSLLGIHLDLVPWEILPFMVMAVGVENTFALTSAVVATSVDLPVRQRVGLGLGRFGGSMTRTLMAEIIILGAGVGLGVPVLKEFCMVAAVAVVIDYLLHITFFITVLSIDMRRLELADLGKHRGGVVAEAEGGAEDDGAPAQGEGRRRRKWCRLISIAVRIGGVNVAILWLFAVITVAVAIVIVIAIYGTTDDASTSASSAFASAAQQAMFANSTSTAVDQFWAAANPSLSDTHLEISGSLIVKLSSTKQPAAPHRTRLPRPSSTPRTFVGEQVDTGATPDAPADDDMYDARASDWTLDVALLAAATDGGPLFVVFVGVIILGCVGAIMVTLGCDPQHVLGLIFPRQSALSSLPPEWLVGPVRQVALRARGDVESFAATEHFVATCSLDRVLRLWDPATGECRAAMPAGAGAAVWHVAADGPWVATAGADGQVSIYDVGRRTTPIFVSRTVPYMDHDEHEAEEAEQAENRGHAAAVHGLIVDADVLGGVVLSGSADRTVRVAALHGGRTLATLRHSAPVAQLLMPKGGTAFVTGASDGSVRLYDLAAVQGSPDALLTLRGHVTPITALAVAPAATATDKRAADTASATQSNATLNAAAESLVDPSPAAPLPALWIASGSEEGQVRVWNSATGECTLALTAHNGPVRQLALDVASGTLLSAGQDECLVLWDVRTQRAVRRIDMAGCTAFAVVDGIAVVAAGTAYRAYELASGRLIGGVGAAAAAERRASFAPALLRPADEAGDIVTRIVSVGGALLSDHGDAVIISHLSAARSVRAQK